MASQADICNLALSNLGQASDITSINPPNGGKYAQVCVQLYPIALEQVLTDADWLFAARVSELSAVEADIPAAWQYAYAVPTGMVKPVRLQTPDMTDPNIGIPFELAGDVLYANEPAVVLRYTHRNTSTAEYPHGFVLAVAAYLSHLLCGPVLKDPAASQAWMRMYQSYLAQGIMQNNRSAENPVYYYPPGIEARWA